MKQFLMGMTGWIYLAAIIMQQPSVLFAMGREDEPTETASAVEIIPLPKQTRVKKDAPVALHGRYFLLERPKLGLNLSFESEIETISNGGQESEDTVTEVREGFTVASQGWLYHPDLMLFGLEFSPEWSQVSQEGMGGEDSQLFIPSYFVDATLLPQKPYTLYLYGRRYEDNLISTFSSRSDLEIDTCGADISFKYKFLPTVFRYQHLVRTQDSFFLLTDERDDFRMHISHLRGNSDTRVSAQYIDSNQTNGSNTNNLTNSFNRILNTYKFRGDPTRKITSDLSYNRTEDESFTSSDLRLLERLYLQHRKNLWSNFTFLYNQLVTNNFEDTTTSLSGELTHQLYDNLTSNIFGSAANNEFIDSGENVFEGGLNFDYHREIPWGMLSITTGFRSIYTQRDGDASSVVVTGEPHSLATGVATFLENETIDIDSIRVTDPTGTIVFVRNQDYFITQVGSFVRIQRSFLGDIANNGNVLVSYQFTGDPDFDDNLFSQSYGATLHLFSSLRLSYNYFQTRQQVLSGREPNNLIDDSSHRLAAQLQWKWTDTLFSYEELATSSTPSRTTWRAEETLTFTPLSTLSLQFSGYYGTNRFEGDSDEETFYGLNSSLHWSPVFWWKAGLEGYYDWETADQADILNSGLQSYIEVNYGKWRGNVSYGMLDFDDHFRDFQRTRHNILFRIMREL